jgi:phosphate transport system ATP-binding protein
MENKIEARHLNLYYGQKHALKDVSLDIKENYCVYWPFRVW